MSRIIICGEDYEIDCPTATWKDEGGFNAYPYKKFNARNLSLEELKEKTSCFVLHHSVTYTAKSCYNVLVSRGLSCNFLIDDDTDIRGYATLYQTLDVKEGSWAQQPFNNAGAGVEICYMPQAWENPNLYSQQNREKFQVPEHEIVDDLIQGRKLKSFAPTEAQINTLRVLIKKVCEVLEIPMTFPRDNNGNIVKSSIQNLKNYNGLLCHFNINNQKYDPAGIDLETLESDLNNI